MKSHVSDYLELAQTIYKDACAQCAAEVSFRDLKTIRSRVKTQGISFLTITLPNFCSDFESCLELGYVDSKYFQNFRKYRAIPAFLRGLLSRLFDVETGRINDETVTSPSGYIDTIRSIRQICLAFKKIKLPCTPERANKALANFVAIENSFEMFSLPREDFESFTLVSSVLWGNIMGALHLDVTFPRHGPGATADKRLGNQKYRWRKWHDRLEPYFPSIDSCYPSSIGELDFISKELELLEVVHSEDEQPVRVITVPKTLKGPRIIAIEPCCMQYTQQGLRRLLQSTIESYWLTKGHINFRDQKVNQSSALISSNDCRYATIDLSDASDRVPRDLALEMFRSNPDLRDAIDACRSYRAKMPNGTIVSLRKFASMGSALCFPIESMYFYTICVMALLESRNLPVSHASCFKVTRDIFVYGDDILVPTHEAAVVLDYLRKYNCKVNDRKTFYRGFFRESCGVDAYNGTSVTPVYIRSVPPKNKQQASEIVSWVATANLLFKAGMLKTSQLLFNKVEKIIGGLPSISEESQVLGRKHFWTSTVPKRFNRRYQRVEVLCWVPGPVYRTDRLDGYAALTKSLIKLEDLESLDAERDFKHLERTARHGAVAITRRWVPATNCLSRV